MKTWRLHVFVTLVRSASFTYDSDSNRVKKVEDGVTTYYIGTHFEWTTFGAVCQTPAPAR